MTETQQDGFGLETAIRLGDLLELIYGRATFGERLSVLVDSKLVEYTAGEPTLYEYGGGFASFAVVNPSADPVYIGTSTRDAAPGGGALVSIPSGAFAVLPYRGRRLGVGGGANAGSVYVLAFAIAQPFAAGQLGATWTA